MMYRCLTSFVQCNWSENVFLGPPFGDAGGRMIDLAVRVVFN